jgi:hypothetical protein
MVSLEVRASLLKSRNFFVVSDFRADRVAAVRARSDARHERQFGEPRHVVRGAGRVVLDKNILRIRITTVPQPLGSRQPGIAESELLPKDKPDDIAGTTKNGAKPDNPGGSIRAMVVSLSREDWERCGSGGICSRH